MFFAEGTFLWNTGLHVFRPVCFVDSLYRMIPEYQFAIPRMMADAESDDPKLVPEFFKMLPNLSLDMGVLERLESFVMECGFDWADIGTWDSIGEESVHHKYKLNCDVRWGSKETVIHYLGDGLRFDLVGEASEHDGLFVSVSD